MPGKEIWQHAPAIKRMRDFERMEIVQADPSMFHGTNQQEQRPGHAQERAKSFADLYADAGVTNLVPFGGDDKSDVSCGTVDASLVGPGASHAVRANRLPKRNLSGQAAAGALPVGLSQPLVGVNGHTPREADCPAASQSEHIRGDRRQG
jgi:hypothetical protein